MDFYCPALRLAIELDGHHHGAAWYSGYESERTDYLRSRRIEIVRITNELIARDSLMAERVIEAAVRRRGEELAGGAE